jgi:hypothetical protein
MSKYASNFVSCVILSRVMKITGSTLDYWLCNKHGNIQCDYIKVMWQGRKADHSSPSSAEVKKVGAIPPLPHMS